MIFVVASGDQHTPSFCSRRITCGTRTCSLPLGPVLRPYHRGVNLHAREHWNRFCDQYVTSVLSSASSFKHQLSQLQKASQNFAADIGFTRSSSGHQAFRRGQDAICERQPPASHPWRRDNCAGGRGNALQAADNAAAIRGMLQKNPEHILRLCSSSTIL